MKPVDNNAISRRNFVQGAAVLGASLAIPSGVYAFGSDVIRVGLVGCGGRGTGAARDCLGFAEGVELVALGDLVPDRLAQCRTELSRAASGNPTIAAGYKVTDERCFTGFDAYEKVLASDVDLVILATPPGFRPAHLAAAVAAGKHVFSEKPVAVDATGARSVLATYELALQKGLGIGVGTQRRHQADYLAIMERIRDGGIGEVLSGRVVWNQGGLWSREKRDDWSDAEWQIRNWLYFAWLSGDHIVEQHVHNLDVANWVIGQHPVRAMGVGGRQWRTEPRFGHIYDHFSVDYEYPGGVRVHSMCRQIAGTANRVEETFTGTRGTSLTTDRGVARIDGAVTWSYEPPPRDQRVTGYQQEHRDLVAGIRAGKPYNELKQIAESTLTAIMGREAAYTGQEITWDELMAADQDLSPPRIAFGPLEVPAVPVPGRTKLARKWGDS
jgi:predicted dehydrogenase